MYLYEKQRLAKAQKEKMDELKQHDPQTIYAGERYKDNKFIQILGSSSHTYGNVLAFIQNWVMMQFPENLFKTIHVNSKIAHRQIRSTPNEYIKKSKPMIIFRPRLEGVEADVLLKGTPLIERQTDLFNTWGDGQLQPFFHDPDKDLSIKFLLNRRVMYVDITLIFATLMQQMDYYDYIVNSLRLDTPFLISTALESYLSQELMEMVAEYVGIPLFDKEGNTGEFLRYMNGHSSYPITFKLQGSTKTREFFRYYPTNIEVTISDIQRDEGERVGNVMDQYQLSFSIKLEFNTTGFYYVIGEKLYDLSHLPKVYPDETNIIPVYTDVLLREDLEQRHGWTLFSRCSVMLEDENDVVNIKQLLNTSIVESVKYYQKNGLPLQEIIDVRVRRQGKVISQYKEYNIDFDTFDITFIDQNTYYTYSILVSVNLEGINQLVMNVYNLK